MPQLYCFKPTNLHSVSFMEQFLFLLNRHCFTLRDVKNVKRNIIFVIVFILRMFLYYTLLTIIHRKNFSCVSVSRIVKCYYYLNNNS